MVVNDLLVDCFPKIMDVTFTADLEEDLDEIEEGNAAHLEVLRKLYSALSDNLSTAKASMPNVKIDGIRVSVPCPSCGESGQMAIRYGRNGFYLSCGACGQTTDFSRDDKGVPQPVAPVSLNQEIFCEKCGKPMIVKKGRFGAFLACSGYPDCRNTKPLTTNENGEARIAEEAGPAFPAEVDPVCPKCGQQLKVKKNKRGSWFIACSAYPKCTHALSLPSDYKCPKEGCPGSIEEKSSHRGPFHSCSEYPACRVIIRGTPVKENCPECGFDYLVESNLASTKGQKLCPNPACPSNAAVQEGHTPLAWYEGRSYPKKGAAASKTAVKSRTASKKTAAAKGSSDDTGIIKEMAVPASKPPKKAAAEKAAAADPAALRKTAAKRTKAVKTEEAEADPAAPAPAMAKRRSSKAGAA